MKELNGIKYTEYGTMEGGDFTATVRVKVNPYLSGVFVRVVKENHREICCGAYDKGNGIIDIDFIVGLLLGFQVFDFNAEIGRSAFHAGPCQSIEGFVINTAGVGDLADFDLGLGWRFSRCSAACGQEQAADDQH